MPASSVTSLNSIGDVVSGRQVRARQFVALPGKDSGKPTGAGAFINAGGTLGYAQVVATQATISVEVALTGLSVTVRVVGSRRIRVSQQTFAGSPSVTPQTVTINIKEGTTFLMQSNVTLSTAGANQTVYSAVILTPTAGMHNYFLSMSTTAGTISNVASATFPSFILVEDIGT
jgi:hypothetical protein